MIYRTLGKTNLNVSVLGLGCAALGGVFGELAEADAIHTVHTALELGVNYLDTAPLYAVTRSEAVVGKALRGIPRDSYYISSKVGRYDINDSDFSYTRVKNGLDATLDRLGCGYLDIAILHDIEFVPLSEVLSEGLQVLEDARAEGKVRFIGASGLPLKIYPAILAHAELDVVITYANYTLQNTALESVLPLLREHHLGVINASPLGLGLLTPQGPQPWHLGDDLLKEKCREAAAWCSSRGVNIAEVGMQFAMANPHIHSTLTGARTADEIRRNVQAVSAPPDPRIVAALQRILAPVRDITWPSGRPEYN
ncbi:MAG TPA: aldo/keto reductase [Bryobacteraceae bacterium]|nr:aldo/keto reductase [Bryobacteraceae bacterium]